MEFFSADWFTMKFQNRNSHEAHVSLTRSIDSAFSKTKIENKSHCATDTNDKIDDIHSEKNSK